MAFGDTHLRGMLGGVFSVPVTMGSGATQQSTRGILRTVDVTEDDNGVVRQYRGQVLTVDATALNGVRVSTILTIDGRAYRVTHPGELGDDARTVRIHVKPNT